jgi:hypothetical protein
VFPVLFATATKAFRRNLDVARLYEINRRLPRKSNDGSPRQRQSKRITDRARALRKASMPELAGSRLQLSLVCQTNKSQSGLAERR